MAKDANLHIRIDELVDNFKFSRELLKIINHFFPDLIPI